MVDLAQTPARDVILALLDGEPAPRALHDRPAAGAPAIAIIGGGFSGTLTAAHLLHVATAAGAALHVVLIDRAGAFAAGAAYRTADDRHLLNVPAARMSAWPDRPASFLDWARARDPGVAGGDFLPRKHYGAYLRAELRAAARAAGPGVTLELRHDDVLDLVARPRGYTVELGATPPIDAVAAVLATGHRQPSDPLAEIWRGPRDRFIADPWPSLEPGAIGDDEPVVVLGTGLSAIDAVLTLTRGPRTAPITAVSRRGLLPRPHATGPIAAVELAPVVGRLLAAGATLRGVLAAVRRQLTGAADWRAVLDGLRPHSAALWGALSPEDRAAFLRHLRPLWEVHRHRMAPGVAAIVDGHAGTGLFRVRAGRVRAVDADQARARLALDLRGGGQATLDAAWVINCTGPGHQRSALPSPLGALVAAGLVEPDPLGLGVVTGAAHQAVAGGRAREDLRVIGTLCKPRLWESTAVPELRVQAETIARQLIARLAPARP